jgi:pimeloyl-ACP methyl ester carboxylesterase|tara:strand:- start:956 stop:1780 length:825 start_codon:yes stop_codon:yes gene_type:complete
LNSQEILNQLPDPAIFKDNKYNLKISYRYQKINKEIPILFLHGFNGSSKSWAYQFDYFKNKRSIIAVDAPGFGQSDPADLDMLSIAHIVYNLLRSINIVRCDLVGHSMGGMLAQIMASQYNSLINKVILSCTHKGYALLKGSPLREPYRLRLEQRKKMSDEKFGQLRIQKMLPELKNEEIFKFLSLISAEINEGSIQSGGMAMQTLDTTDYLSKLNQDCLILKGSKDIVVSNERSYELEKLLKHAKIKELQNVGHAPYCEDANTFNGEVENFFK